MLRSKILTGAAVRVGLVLALLGAVAAVASPSMIPYGIALADDDNEKEKGKGDDADDGNPGRGNDAKAEKEKKPKKEHEGKGNDDGGEGDAAPVVIEQAPDTTPIVVTPAPTPTAAPREVGTLKVLVRACPGGTPQPVSDWTAACTAPAGGGRFELIALDGVVAGWHLDLEAPAEGDVDAPDLPTGRYGLEPDGTRWCHAESDRVDAEGWLAVVAGETTTVWIFTCVRTASA